MRGRQLRIRVLELLLTQLQLAGWPPPVRHCDGVAVPSGSPIQLDGAILTGTNLVKANPSSLGDIDPEIWEKLLSAVQVSTRPL
jgi:hypothetical protein